MRINRLCLGGAQKGLTLIELLVAMVLSLVVVLLSGLALTGAATGLRTTDASAQLLDSSAMVSSMLQRSVSQAGYQPSGIVQFTREAYYATFGALPYPDVYGRSNVKMGSGSAAVSSSNVVSFYAGSGGGGLSTSAGIRGSDLLAIRFQAVPENNEGKKGVTALVDLCTGSTLVTDAYNQILAGDQAEMHKPIYTFFVGADPKDSSGGVLYCKSWVGASDVSQAVATPVTDGVVAFKVLYGIFKPGTVTAQGAPTDWKPASSMSATDWYNVKRIRVGLVLQSRPGAGPAHNTDEVFYPLGKEFANSGNVGSKITVNYGDGRLYRVMNFTIPVLNLLRPRNG